MCQLAVCPPSKVAEFAFVFVSLCKQLDGSQNALFSMCLSNPKTKHQPNRLTTTAPRATGTTMAEEGWLPTWEREREEEEEVRDLLGEEEEEKVRSLRRRRRRRLLLRTRARARARDPLRKRWWLEAREEVEVEEAGAGVPAAGQAITMHSSR